MRTTDEELYGLAALCHGVDAAAEVVGIDEEVYQRALDGDYLTRGQEAEIDTAFADYAETFPETIGDIERCADFFYNLNDSERELFLDAAVDNSDRFDVMMSEWFDYEFEYDSPEYWEWFREFYDD